MYKIALAKKAEYFYLKLYSSDREHFKRISVALEGLKTDPFQGKPLKFELKGHYSLRVGFYRIIYTIERQEVMIIVLDIGHRREIYKTRS